MPVPVQDELNPIGDYFLIRGKYIDVDGVRLDRVINQVEDDISRIKTESYTKQQADDKFAAKTDVYTKSEVDTALSGKVSVQSGYGLISDAEKAQIQTNVANITAAETAIAGKASQEEVNTIKSDVAGKASVESVTQLQNEMAVQEARMDQLVGTVPEGSADEIADARVTADGKTEANLGNAIRSQVSGLNETIAATGLIEDINYEWHPEYHGYIDYRTGRVTVLESSSYNYSGWINVQGLKAITFTNVTSKTETGNSGMAFLDGSRTYISGYSVHYGHDTAGYETITIDVPNNAVYARFTRYADESRYGTFKLTGIKSVDQKYYNDYKKIEQWMYASLVSTTGVVNPELSKTRAISTMLPTNVVAVNVVDNLNVRVFAYDETGYLGVWNGAEFDPSATRIGTADITEIRKLYPNASLYLAVIADEDAIQAAKEKIQVTIDLTLTEEDATVDTNDPLKRMIDVAETYMNVAYSVDDKINYLSWTGLYGNEVTDENGVKMIQCSEFVYAMLTGTTYENSRYVTGKDGINTPARWGWATDGNVEGLNYLAQRGDGINGYNYPDFLQADQLAKYFDAKGMLHKYDKQHNDMQLGDIVFVSDEKEEYESNFKKIHHCAIVCGYTEKGFYTLDGGKDVDRIYYGDKAAMSIQAWSNNNTVHTYYYVHCPISSSVSARAEKISEIKMYRPVNLDHTSSSTTIIETIATLKKGFYTVFVDVDDAENVVYRLHTTYLNAGNPYDYIIDEPTSLKTKRFFTYIQSDDSVTLIRAKLQGANSDKSVGIKRVRIYKGWVADAPDEQ